MIFHDQAYLGFLYGVKGYFDIFEKYKIGPAIAINPGNAYLVPKNSPYKSVEDIIDACGKDAKVRVAINTPAAIIPIRTLQNLSQNPNLGNEVLVLGLGCEKLDPNRLVPTSQGKLNFNEPQTLKLQDFNGFEAMVSEIMELAEQKLERLNKRERVTCPASDLVVGMQCGGSDAFSGFTANPAVGFATDLIVRAGGTVMFSEVTEVRDGVQLLFPRVASEEVGKALIEDALV